MKPMREKVLIIVIVVFGLAVAYGQRQPPLTATAPAAQGRYQLVAGSNLVGDSTMYRIDTVTGRTWAMAIKSERNGYIWGPVDEDSDRGKRP